MATDSDKSKIPLMCEECGRRMHEKRDAAGIVIWVCVCGHAEGEVVDPRHAPPVPNVHVHLP